MTVPAAASPASLASPEPTHACVRCGARVAVDVGLCEACNPLGLRDVSATQVHGVAFIGVTVAIIALALVARLAVSGIGPFTPRIAGLVTEGDALAITLTVTNEGSSAGRTTCRLMDPLDRNGGGAELILSPSIEPGQTLTFSRRLTTLGSEVRDLAVECSAP